MGSKYQLSFCIVTCNQPRELERLLNSLLFQDLESVEIIIRDDSKNNKSKLVVDKYLHKMELEYYHLEASGVDVAIQYVVKKANKKELKTQQKPWITKGIITSMRKRDIIFRKLIKCNSQVRKNNLQVKYRHRNSIVSLIKS